jgi:hypothetical protein
MLEIESFKSALKNGLARSNLFKVNLPTIPNMGIQSGGLSAIDRNLLCKATNLPGRQIITNERMIGVKAEKLAYGFLQEDVSMTFHVTNDYGLKKYFQAWQALIIDPDTYELSFKNEYSREVQIHQLDHQENIIYTCKLIEAFPTTVNAIELNNDPNGLVEINVQLSYRDWDTPRVKAQLILEE